MPKKTEKEIQQLIESGEIIGFTLDTTEFHHAGYNFQSKILKALSQFKETDVTLLFSEVVLNEVHAHIRDDIKSKTDQLRSLLRQVGKAAVVAIDPAKIMLDADVPTDAGVRAKELVDQFVLDVGAERVSVDDGPSVRLLHDLYFGSQPPFSNKADKKNEFPDAMALLSLQHWAEQNDGFVLAISNDGDWRRFAERSPSIIVMQSLSSALNHYNQDNAFVAARVASNLDAGTALSLIAKIDSVLEDALEIFDVDANAPYYYEAEDQYAIIKAWEVIDRSFDVVESDAQFVTFALNLNVKATFYASFSFTVRDGIDKDYIKIGGTEASITEDFEAQILITVARDDDSPDPEVVEIEIDTSPLMVDFGYVDVDYGDNHDEEW